MQTKIPITDEIKPHIAQLLDWIFQTTLNSGGDGTAFLYLRDHSIEQLSESGILANLPDGWQVIKDDKYLSISEFETEIERQRFYDCFVVY